MLNQDGPVCLLKTEEASMLIVTVNKTLAPWCPLLFTKELRPGKAGQ